MSTADKDNLSFRIENAEAELADWLARHAISLLRVSLGVVFDHLGPDRGPARPRVQRADSRGE
jgi:hypothetical protein